jgi:hypothetical protein
MSDWSAGVSTPSAVSTPCCKYIYEKKEETAVSMLYIIDRIAPCARISVGVYNACEDFFSESVEYSMSGTVDNDPSPSHRAVSISATAGTRTFCVPRWL